MSKTFNPVAAVQDLRAAGIDPKHADAYVDVLWQAFVARHHDKPATKTDLSAYESPPTKEDLRSLRGDLRGDMYWAVSYTHLTLPTTPYV